MEDSESGANKTNYKNYDILNISKFIAAILVIIIHSLPVVYSNTPTIEFIFSGIITRLAVPFFFVSSGYLFYTKFEQNNKYIFKYIYKIIKIYLMWTIVYFPLNLDGMVNNKLGIIKNIILYIRDIFFCGSYFHLWFLVSLIYSMAFVWIFIKNNKLKTLIACGSMLYAIGLCGDSYYGLIEGTFIDKLVNGYKVIFGYTKNGLTFGVIFITIGILINKYTIDQKIKNNTTLVIISLVFLFSEAFILKIYNIPSEYNMFISLIIVTPLIFIIIIKQKIKINKRYSVLFRELSLLMYCSHIFIIILMNNIINILNVNFLLEHTIIKIVLIIVLSVLWAYGLLILKSIKSKKCYRLANNSEIKL